MMQHSFQPFLLSCKKLFRCLHLNLIAGCTFYLFPFDLYSCFFDFLCCQTCLSRCRRDFGCQFSSFCLFVLCEGSNFDLINCTTLQCFSVYFFQYIRLLRCFYICCFCPFLCISAFDIDTVSCFGSTVFCPCNTDLRSRYFVCCYLWFC